MQNTIQVISSSYKDRQLCTKAQLHVWSGTRVLDLVSEPDHCTQHQQQCNIETGTPKEAKKANIHCSPVREQYMLSATNNQHHLTFAFRYLIKLIYDEYCCFCVRESKQLSPPQTTTILESAVCIPHHKIPPCQRSPKQPT